MSFKVAPSNDRVLCIYAPPGHSSREQLVRVRFFEGLQNYLDSKTGGNENKIVIGDFSCTLEKMDRGEGNKTQKRYGCHSNFALSKFIMDNGLEDLWRRENLTLLILTLSQICFKNSAKITTLCFRKQLINVQQVKRREYTISTSNHARNNDYCSSKFLSKSKRCCQYFRNA